MRVLLIAAAVVAVVAIIGVGAFMMMNDRSEDSGDDYVPVSGDLHMYIDGTEVSVQWEDNKSVSDLKALARDGLEISTSRYGGFEQVGGIGKKISSSDRSLTSQPGDIFLYRSQDIVVFFGENSYSYTKLGRITYPDGDALTGLLDRPGTTIRLELSQV